MTTTVILALGTNDGSDTPAVTTKNVTDIIESLRNRGYQTFIVVPPNPDQQSSLNTAVINGATGLGVTVYNVANKYSTPEPRQLTAESAAEIRNAYPDAVCVGDHNAVRINGFKSTEVAKTESTTGDTLKRVEYRMPEPTTSITETGSGAITITEQDKNLLDLISKTNLTGTTYYSYYLAQKEPRLTEWTLMQVQYFQAKLLRRNGKLRESSAVGKYQLIKSAMKMAYRYLKLDPKRVRFTEEIQDALMIGRLEHIRKYNDWKTGKMTDEDFCIQLALEFDSIPVPRSMTANEVRNGVPKQDLLAGQSFYTGDYIFTEGHNLKAFLQTLSDLRKAGPGKVYKIDVTLGSANSAAPRSGKTLRRTAEHAASGGNRISGGRRVNTNPNTKLNLPSTGEVYQYQSIDPYDDRYDFRTGKQVKDVGINQTNSVLENPNYTVKGNDPLQEAGVAPEFNPVPETKVPPGNELIDFETQEPINPTQEEKIEAAKEIVKELELQGITDKKTQAKILATVDQTSRLSARTSNATESQLLNFRSRGYAQIKGQENYTAIGDRIGVDLVNNPDLANDPSVSAKMTADFYKTKSETLNITSTRNLYTATNGFDPYLTSDPLKRAQGVKDIKTIDALSVNWEQELDRINPTEQVTSTTNYVELLDGGLEGVTDKPLPTGRSLPSPTNFVEITPSIEEAIDSVNDSDYNELLAQDYLGEDTNGNVIDKVTGDIIGVKPLPTEIKYDTRGNIVLNKPNWEFIGNGSGAIRSV